MNPYAPILQRARPPQASRPAVSIRVATFRGTAGTAEHQVMAIPLAEASIERQVDALRDAYDDALQSRLIARNTVVFRRFFCTDPAAQAPLLRAAGLAGGPEAEDGGCAVSIVGQPPLSPARIAMWAWHIDDPAAPPEKCADGEALILRRNGRIHAWSAGLTELPGADAYLQTHAVFRRYGALLDRHGMNWADHVMRTWIFIPRIDFNYNDMVQARNEVFAREGLGPETHTVASTGIEGDPAHPYARVMLDAWAVGGLMPQQVSFLTAPAHLCPTHRYGVAFERGTAIDYRDRRQLVISGTASIDARGEILHPGNLRAQFDRALANVNALLARGGATYADLQYVIAYVRRPGDRAEIVNALRRRLPFVPAVVVMAPVCRPGWLVEVEGMATVAAAHARLPAF